MKTAAILVLSTMAILAADPAPETGPQFQGEYAEVPDPVPVGYDKCIMAITFPEHVPKWWRVYTFPAPISEQKAADLNLYRRAKIGRLEHCVDEQT